MAARAPPWIEKLRQVEDRLAPCLKRLETPLTIPDKKGDDIRPGVTTVAVERNHILRALRIIAENHKRVAELLDIGAQTL